MGVPKKAPLSNVKAIRPLPPGFMPPSLRQAAHFANKLLKSNGPNIGLTKEQDEDEEDVCSDGEIDRRNQNQKITSAAPNPSVYFKGFIFSSFYFLLIFFIYFYYLLGDRGNSNTARSNVTVDTSNEGSLLDQAENGSGREGEGKIEVVVSSGIGFAEDDVLNDNWTAE